MESGLPCFPRDSSCPAVLWILPAVLQFQLRGSHPLWLAFPCHSFIFVQCFMQSATPQVFLLLVWPLPISLATTFGISVDFSSSPYLDVSVREVRLIYLCIQYMILWLSPQWVPPFGYLRITSCLRIPVAFRSYPRPSSPLSAKAFALRPL